MNVLKSMPSFKKFMKKKDLKIESSQVSGRVNPHLSRDIVT